MTLVTTFEPDVFPADLKLSPGMWTYDIVLATDRRPTPSIPTISKFPCFGRRSELKPPRFILAIPDRQVVDHLSILKKNTIPPPKKRVLSVFLAPTLRVSPGPTTYHTYIEPQTPAQPNDPFSNNGRNNNRRLDRQSCQERSPVQSRARRSTVDATDA